MESRQLSPSGLCFSDTEFQSEISVVFCEQKSAMALVITLHFKDETRIILKSSKKQSIIKITRGLSSVTWEVRLKSAFYSLKKIVRDRIAIFS